LLFTSSYFLWGLLALGLPVIIHMIFRLRKRRVLFSTLKFLKVVQEKNARRLRVRELLLLLLRLAILACIVLAFARPFFRGQEVDADVMIGRTDVVFVLDDSFSMQAQDGTRTLFEQGKDRIVSWVRRLNSGSRVGLIATSEPHRLRLRMTSSIRAFPNRLHSRTVPASWGSGSIPAALRTAVRELQASTAENRVVVLVSDLQRAGWSPDQLRNDEELQRDAGAAGIQFEVVAFPPAVENIAVVNAQPQSSIVGGGKNVPFGVQVAAYGAQADGRRLLSLHGRDAAEPLARRSIEVRAGRTVGASLQLPVSAAGETAGMVEVETTDALPGDDRRYWMSTFRRRLRVVCVEDQRQPESRRFLNRAYPLRQALDPKLKDGESDTNYIRAVGLSAHELTARELDRADVVIFCSVTRLSDQQTEALARFVRNGGGLILFVGGTDMQGNDWLPDTAFYDGRLLAEGLLPARPTVAEGVLGDPKRARRIARADVGHPLLKLFQGQYQPLLRQPRFYRTWQLNQEDLKRESVQVLAWLDDDRPLIVEKATGEGRVLMIATSAAARPNRLGAPDEVWSDLPRVKALPLLMHSAVRWLTERHPTTARQFIVGDVLDFGLTASDHDRSLQLVRPDGREQRFTPGETVRAERPGVYALRVTDGIETQTRYAAVNVPAAESDLHAYDVEEVADVFEGGQVDRPAVTRKTQLDRHSPEALKRKITTWRWFLLAALGLLALEALVANVLMRAK
jgi:uncharacterized membrane protein